MTNQVSNFEKLYDSWIQSENKKRGPKDGIVYHYTDARGLMGIIESGLLRATDYRFLNDRSEFTFGIDNSKTLCGRLAKGTSQIKLRNFLKNVVEYLEIPDEVNRSFVASFSDRKDDLSQWRGYANEGQGYTIGLDADWFSTQCMTHKRKFDFARVSYSSDEFQKTVAKIINEFFSALPTRSTATVKDEAASWCDATIEAACALHKHASFAAESEWRLITYHYDDTLRKIKVKPKSTGLVPYTEIDLKNGDGKIPLRSIGIGPSITNVASDQAVGDLCRKHGYECEIYRANSPFNRE